MRHVRVPLRLHELLDADRAGNADAREVVAAEVDEHHVLGAVLLRREQRLGVALARRDRAGDRVERGARAFALDHRLRRAADEREPVELQQEEIRRRVDAAERAVELERRRGGRPLGALRDHDLEDVALADVLLRALDAAQVLVAVGEAAQRPGHAAAGLGLRLRAGEHRPPRRPGRRRASPRRRAHGRSGRAAPARRTGSPGSRAPARGAEPSARTAPPRRSRGSRPPARRAPPPRRSRRAASRSRRRSAARAARAPPTRAGTTRARPAVRAGAGRPRAG